MKITKEKIQEIIDGNTNMIGSNDAPEMSPDIETRASKTTDYNAKVHGQNLEDDFLGHFGFYFYESEGDNSNVEDILAKIMYEKYKETLDYYHKNPKKLDSDWDLHNTVDFDSQPEDSREHDYEWASDILKVLAPHMKNDLNESNVTEDKIKKDKKDRKDLVSKNNNNDIINKKMKKVADLLDKLSDNGIDKLINVLESKRNK